jgi:putative transposase
MPRPLRWFEPGASFHVIQRGHNRCEVFRDDADCDRFLAEVRRAAVRWRTSVHGFALMKTHYHLVVTPSTHDSLPYTVKQFGGEYVRYFNRKYECIGTLWSDRYRSIWIKDDRQVLTCLRYVDRNPVAAHLVDSPEKYRWSSYRAHAFGASEMWLVEHPTYTGLGQTAQTRRAVYRTLCSAI